MMTDIQNLIALGQVSDEVAKMLHAIEKAVENQGRHLALVKQRGGWDVLSIDETIDGVGYYHGYDAKLLGSGGTLMQAIEHTYATYDNGAEE